MSLAKSLSAAPLVTDVGAFTYVEQIGQGGNGTVFRFDKGGKSFAIKFLENAQAGKLGRFQDEYFCTLQLPAQKNIVRPYHFDTVNIGEHDYSLIIMRLYERVLSGMERSHDNDEVRAERGRKLFHDLFKGIGHLHKNGVIHRDIKPENIFFDGDRDCFVLGDMGIAHFSDDSFARQSKTRHGERVANFAFSPPEQAEKGYEPVPNCDIYAMGQVLSWYLFGTTVRGSGRRPYAGDNAVLSVLDRVIDRCVRNDPDERFQCVDEIHAAMNTWTAERPRDAWEKLHDFDGVIRSSFPRIDELYETVSPTEIQRFLAVFTSSCRLDEFWFELDGHGDNTVQDLQHLEGNRWLLCGVYELNVSKVICYKHRNVYKSLAVLILGRDEPFPLRDFDGNVVARKVPASWTEDHAVLHEGNYTDPDASKNGFFERGDTVHQIEGHQDRIRLLVPSACLIVPAGSGPASSFDREPVRRFLEKAAQAGTFDRGALDNMLRETDDSIDHRYWSMA